MKNHYEFRPINTTSTPFAVSNISEQASGETRLLKNNQVLIKIKAISAEKRQQNRQNGGGLPGRFVEWIHSSSFTMRRFGFSGIIQAVGSSNGEYPINDEVFGTALLKGGSTAYVILSENGDDAESGLFYSKPDLLTFEEAAIAAADGLTALGLLNTAKVHRGQSILVVTAENCLSTWIIQLALCFGAGISAIHLPGSDQRVKYPEKVQVMENPPMGNDQYDVIIDTGGMDISHYKSGLKPGGKYLTINDAAEPYLVDLVFLQKVIVANLLQISR